MIENKMNEHCKPKNRLFKHDEVKLSNWLFNRTLGEFQKFLALKNSGLNKNFPISFSHRKPSFYPRLFSWFFVVSKPGSTKSA